MSGPSTDQKQQTNQSTTGSTFGSNDSTSLVSGNSTTQSLGTTTGQTAQQQQTGNVGFQQNDAYAPAEPVLNSMLTRAGDLSSDLTGDERTALAGLTSQAGSNAGFNTQLQGAATRALEGGNYNEGDEMVRQGYQTASAAFTPYARGDYLDFNNPQLQGMLSTLKDDINNSVGSTFAAAGRTGSGAHAQALGRGYAAGLAPTMLDWYTGQQRQQLDAAGAVTGSANAAAGALGANEGARLATAQGAPSLLDATYSPYAQSLTAAGYGASTPYERLGMLNNIVMPAASQFGSSTNANQGFSNATGQSAQQTANLSNTQSQQLTQSQLLSQLYKDQTGSGTTNTHTQQNVDPLMLALGGGVTLGSAYLGA